MKFMKSRMFAHTLLTLFVSHSIFNWHHFLAANILSHSYFNNNNSNGGNLYHRLRFFFCDYLFRL